MFKQIWAEQSVENGKRDAAISFFYNSSVIPCTSIRRMAGASPHIECADEGEIGQINSTMATILHPLDNELNSNPESSSL